MISVKVGFDEEAIARIYAEDLTGPLKYGGDTTLGKRIVREFRHRYDDNASFLRDMPKKLHSRIWAELERDDHGE